MKSAAIAYVSAHAFKAIGSHFDGLPAAGPGDGFNFGGNYLTGSQVAQQIFAHAMVGGVSSHLQGGKFGHGFFSAGITKAAGGAFLAGSADLNGPMALAKNTMISAMIGGTASVISGGKFANGAKTAAMQYMLNQAGRALQKVDYGQIWKDVKRTWSDYLSDSIKSDPLANYLSNNADLSAEATACFGPCVSGELEVTKGHGVSANGSLVTEWGAGTVLGGGSDITLYNSTNMTPMNNDITFFRGFGFQLGPVGLSTTRFDSGGGHVNTNVELKLRYPGGFAVYGGSGVKVW